MLCLLIIWTTVHQNNLKTEGYCNTLLRIIKTLADMFSNQLNFYKLGQFMTLNEQTSSSYQMNVGQDDDSMVFYEDFSTPIKVHMER